MKIEIIRSTIDKSNQVLSIGNYWNNKGMVYKLESFEYIGDEMGLTAALHEIRDNRDAEFMHVVNRMIAQ
jgi:hypothetical protein